MPVNVAVTKLFDKGPDTSVGKDEVAMVVIVIGIQGNLLVVVDPGRQESK